MHFREFKNQYHQAKMVELAKKILSGSPKLTVADLLKVAKAPFAPWERAFNFENTMKAWASIGVIPFNQCVYWDCWMSASTESRLRPSMA